LQVLVAEVTENMNNYKLAEASRPIMEFVLELSQWYVRRSRGRFKGDDEQDKQFALSTLREVLLILSKVMAPFTPFIAEKIYMGVNSNQSSVNSNSVHLEMWPEVSKDLVDEEIIEQMILTRKVVEESLFLRKDAKIKVRQPLQKLTIDKKLSDGLREIIAEEVNVKEVVEGKKLELDTELTKELKNEGLMREIVRAVNQIRKEKGLTRESKVSVEYSTDDVELKAVFEEFNEEIKKQVLADSLKEGVGETEVEINQKKLKLKVNPAPLFL